MYNVLSIKGSIKRGVEKEKNFCGLICDIFKYDLTNIENVDQNCRASGRRLLIFV
jgi:hypothetical protein